MGVNTGDDAGVYRLSDELALVATVDFFTPIVDDPYDFGRIAAANSLSDIYAMGGKPLFALSIVGFPATKAPLDILARILQGGTAKAKEAGIEIVGGHSVDDPEPKFGLAVTGAVHPDRVMTNNSPRLGDRLVLTKPLGSGVLTTAIKKGLLPPAGIEQVVEIMASLNAPAATAMGEVGAHACTDVTGFGLIGHLRGMLRDTGLGARISLAGVPVMPGVWDLTRQGVHPGGTRRNLDHFGAQVRFGGDLPAETPLVLGDPQTSGGLLIAVAPDRADDLIAALRQNGVGDAASIGEVIEDPAEVVDVVS